MILTFLSKVIGFFRDIILAYFYGASSTSDAYLISLVIPSVVFGFIGVGIVSAYIPMYNSIEQKYGSKEGDIFTNNLVNVILVFSALLFIICAIFAEPLVKVFASGFEGKTLRLAISFTRITLASMFFGGIVFIFSGYLQIKGNHLAPSLMGLPLNLALIMGIILGSIIHINFLPYGKVAAVLLQLLFLLLFVYKKGFKYKPVLDLKDKHVKKMCILALPVILSSSVEQINKLIDRTIASNLAIGGISALNYANQLILFVQGIFVTSIMLVCYPIISKMAAKGNMIGLKNSLGQLIVVINVILIPATVGTIILAEPIIRLLFGRGAFTNDAIEMTSIALLFYSLGLVGFGIREVLNKAFYSLQDTRTPMINAMLSMLLNIVLNIILSRYLGVGGLALATSISGIVCTILLFISLRKKIGFFKVKIMMISFLKVLINSIIMGIMVKFSYMLLSDTLHLSVSLLISIIIGIAVYSLLIYFIKIKEVDEFILELKRKRKRVS